MKTKAPVRRPRASEKSVAGLGVSTVLASLLFFGSTSTGRCDPTLLSVSIDPPHWDGFGLYETIPFTCVPQWDDAVADTNCTRAGSPPEWTAIDYGTVATTYTCNAEWNSGHGAGTGELQVVYGGLTSSVPLTGTLPTDDEYPDHYNTYPDIFADSSTRAYYLGFTLTQLWAYVTQQYASGMTLSTNLEAYIRDWLNGLVPDALPPDLLPDSMDNPKTTNWTLCLPEDVTPEQQWYVRPANEVPDDFSKLYFLGPDNHVTYMKCIFVAPYGSTLIIDGEFPHCRFLSCQILPPFDPFNPTTSAVGAPEVPIVDVDIDPLAGHTNPFRPGADRNATNRGYHLEFYLTKGNSVTLNPQAMQSPAFRAPDTGNQRVGGPFASGGPEADGELVASVVWIRYYAPDHGVGPLGGVPLPKARLRLSTGEEFWIKCDFSLAERRQNKTIPGHFTIPFEPPPSAGPQVGWLKLFGFWLAYAEGQAWPLVEPWQPTPKSNAVAAIRIGQAAFFHRNPYYQPPGNYEVSASGCPYNTYLVRPIPLGYDDVIVLTGKLPTTPLTRNGESPMTTAEARYISFTHTGNGPGGYYKSLLYGGLMDDEIALDSDRRYIIAYSRDNFLTPRPTNAVPHAGVTWQEWGSEAFQVLNMRWMSVMPEWSLPEYAPHSPLLPWTNACWSQVDYDAELVGNNCPGRMGEYQPIIGYMTRAEFEALGNPVTVDELPFWNTSAVPSSVTMIGEPISGVVTLRWDAVGPVWIDCTESLLGTNPAWQVLDGPITNDVWSGPLPAGVTNVFIRLRHDCGNWDQ